MDEKHPCLCEKLTIIHIFPNNQNDNNNSVLPTFAIPYFDIICMYRSRGILKEKHCSTYLYSCYFFLIKTLNCLNILACF